MVIDTSALLAILLGEPEAEKFAAAMVPIRVGLCPNVTALSDPMSTWCLRATAAMPPAPCSVR